MAVSSMAKIAAFSLVSNFAAEASRFGGRSLRLGVGLCWKPELSDGDEVALDSDGGEVADGRWPPYELLASILSVGGPPPIGWPPPMGTLSPALGLGGSQSWLGPGSRSDSRNQRDGANPNLPACHLFGRGPHLGWGRDRGREVLIAREGREQPIETLPQRPCSKHSVRSRTSVRTRHLAGRLCPV